MYDSTNEDSPERPKFQPTTLLTPSTENVPLAFPSFIPPPPAPSVSIAEDDDFGDFNNVQAAPAIEPMTNTLSFIEKDEFFEKTKTFTGSIEPLFNELNPSPQESLLFQPLADYSCRDDQQKRYFTIHDTYKNSSWAEFIEHLTSTSGLMDNITGNVRWKKSSTRKLMCDYLDTIETKLEKSVPEHGKNVPKPTPVTVSKEAELEEAKKMCELTEGSFTCLTDQVDLLANKSLDELKEISKKIHFYTTRMQEHTSYWMDAKEQLLLDAEMHNKMIASLVQYAQQQRGKPI